MPKDILCDKIRNQYLERLKDILKNGFVMNKGNETIYGMDGSKITAGISRTCFTEIKLSLAKQHASRYGSLGIGVDRNFVLERCGGPVFYIQNGNHSNIIENFSKVLSYLQNNNQHICDEFGIICGYLKNMSDQNEDSLKYYDEMEWRITHLTRLNEKYFQTQNESKHIYRIMIVDTSDIKVLVFPDGKTKEMALNNSDIIKLIENPICTTLDDCEHF